MDQLLVAIFKHNFITFKNFTNGFLYTFSHRNNNNYYWLMGISRPMVIPVSYTHLDTCEYKAVVLVKPRHIAVNINLAAHCIVIKALKSILFTYLPLLSIFFYKLSEIGCIYKFRTILFLSDSSLFLE